MDMATAQLMWFEDQLISRYGRTIDALDIGLKSTVDFFKKFSMGVCLDLISGKPEQEQRLLGMLINKLGDAVGGACSRASQLLKTLVQNHGAMKGVVVREVRQFIHRPNLNPKSLYNAVIFLNQLTLTYHDTQVAEALIETFVGLFEKAVASKEMSSKLLAGLLNGINKAYPFLKDPSLLQAHVDALFRIVHVATFSAATQALLLISLMALAENKATNKVAKGTEILGEGPSQADGISRRYYRALYEKLLAEQVSRSLVLYPFRPVLIFILLIVFRYSHVRTIQYS